VIFDRQPGQKEGGDMRLTIETRALELTFRMLLTCGCPVTKDEEKALFDLIQSFEGPQIPREIPYARVLSIFPAGTRTPFHRIRDFYVWQAPTAAESHRICRDHIIRHFASSYHWDHVVARGLEEGYGQVTSIASWFLGHMLLPARVVSVGRTHVSLVHTYPGGEIQLKGLFFPNAWPPAVDEIWAVHFAGLLDRLSPAECETARFMLEQNSALGTLRREVSQIDYRDFQRKGDYAAFCRTRYERYYA